MADFTREDLAGSRFEQVDLAGARFRNVDLTGAVIRGALLVNVEIDGLLQDVTVNGVDVVPLVEAELDRRYPDRAKMRPADADGFRQAWDILERLWQQTVARARGMPPDLLHERVDDEWSFIETLRHLVFATDAWVRRGIRWACRTTRCPTKPMSRGTRTPARRWTRCSPCAPTAWPPCARCSLGSPTPSWPGGPNRSPRPAIRPRRASPCAGACRPSSPRNGSTACSPNATSPSSNPGYPAHRAARCACSTRNKGVRRGV